MANVPNSGVPIGGTNPATVDWYRFFGDIKRELDGKQPLDADLTAIAALATAAFGLSFLEASDKEAFFDLLDINSDGTIPIADDQVGAIATLPASVTGFLFVAANTAADASIFGIDTTAANAISTKFLGTSVENGGVGTPSPGDGTDGSFGVYIGTDDIVRISNRRGGALTFAGIFLGVRF